MKVKTNAINEKSINDTFLKEATTSKQQTKKV